MADLYQIQHGQMVQLNDPNISSGGLGEEQVNELIDAKIENFKPGDTLPEGGIAGQVLLIDNENNKTWGTIASTTNNLAVGQIVYSGGNTEAPEGCLFANGSYILKDDYPELTKLLTPEDPENIIPSYSEDCLIIPYIDFSTISITNEKYNQDNYGYQSTVNNVFNLYVDNNCGYQISDNATVKKMYPNYLFCDPNQDWNASTGWYGNKWNFINFGNIITEVERVDKNKFSFYGVRFFPNDAKKTHVVSRLLIEGYNDNTQNWDVLIDKNSEISHGSWNDVTSPSFNNGNFYSRFRITGVGDSKNEPALNRLYLYGINEKEYQKYKLPNITTTNGSYACIVAVPPNFQGNINKTEVKEILNNSLGEILKGGRVSEGNEYSISVDNINNKYYVNLVVPSSDSINLTDAVIGLCRSVDETEQSGYFWKYITSNGHKFSETPNDYFNKHLIYKNIQTEMIGTNYMVRIPKFYIKHDYEGWGTDRTFWISPYPMEDFHVHPAFISNGEELDQFWVGAYQATCSGSSSNYKLVSTPGSKPLVNTTPNNFNTYANRNNASGVDGYSVINVYQLSAIRYLMMLEYGTGRIDSAMGYWNWSISLSTSVTNNDSRLPLWRGIYGLYGNVQEYTSGCETDASGNIQILSNAGDGTLIDTGISIAEGIPQYDDKNIGGYAKDMQYASGDNYDLKDVQLIYTCDFPNSEESDEEQISKTPYESWKSVTNTSMTNRVYTPGIYFGGVDCGIFTEYWTYEKTQSSTLLGTRLAKI